MFLISVRQVQATVVGLLAALVALLLGAVSSGELDFAKVELLCASSVITAFLAALALGELCPNPSAYLLQAGPMPHLPPPGWPHALCAFSSKKTEHYWWGLGHPPARS